MSATGWAPKLAASLIRTFGDGLAVTFARTFVATDSGSTFDPIANAYVAPDPVTWTAKAVQVNDKPSATFSRPNGTGQRVTVRSLLVVGQGITYAPLAGDAATVGSLTYTIGAVDAVGDVGNGTVPFYRVAVNA